MKLEQEILSNKFESSYHKSAVNIIYTYNWLTNKFRQRLNLHAITLQQYNVLRILRGQFPNPATVNLLRERMLDRMCDASRIVDRLVQKELVTRSTNSKDRRAVDIVISTKGMDLLLMLDDKMTAADFLKDHFTEDEAALLSDLLDRFRG
ncbi:MAG TPA: MarR family transcriptional regulator [Sphingobacteriaceae bacterium]